MKKLILFSVIMLMLVGVVSADHVISDLEGINIPLGNVYAGSSFEANFSFNYFGAPQNEAGSPLIIQLNITSNDSSYPVYKNEFEISGRIKKYHFFGMIPGDEVEFECNESENQIIEHPKDAASVVAPNGTFYCYNEDGDLDLNEHDKIFLTIISHPAIYPGEYNISAGLFYLNDERSPFINITNKNDFDLYYREIDNVEISATIEDGSDIAGKWGTIFANYNITVPFSHETLGINYFTKVLPANIVEGDYPLLIFAEDEYNNIGNDSVILKIDLTAPDITLIQPSSNSTYGENDSLVIEVGAVDAKAGLDSSTVKYRLSEIVNGSFCPSTGVIFGNYSCYNSGWVTDWNVEDFKTELNISGSDFVSGSYWLEASACDILENCGVL